MSGIRVRSIAGPTAAAADLALCGLSVRYRDAVAVRNLALTARRGEITAVIGPNGAGKTSLISAVYGAVRATGTVRLGDQALSQMSSLHRLRSGVGLVPQGRQLFPRLTVRENLVVMRDLLQLPLSSVDAAIGRFPILKERADSIAGVLSGGEQQMLVVTRALMGDPKVLLCDEMMTGLAPMIVQDLSRVLLERARTGVVVLLAEPTVGAALRPIITTGAVMIRGEVVASSLQGGAALDDACREAMGLTPTSGRRPASEPEETR